MLNKIQIYKFNLNTDATINDIYNSEICKTLSKDKLTQKDKDYLFYHAGRGTKNFIRQAGWIIDLSNILNRYLVKQYDNWTEYYAFNKTSIRHELCGRIQEIIQI